MWQPPNCLLSGNPRRVSVNVPPGWRSDRLQLSEAAHPASRWPCYCVRGDTAAGGAHVLSPRGLCRPGGSSTVACGSAVNDRAGPAFPDVIIRLMGGCIIRHGALRLVGPGWDKGLGQCFPVASTWQWVWSWRDDFAVQQQLCTFL